jgi:hypothetical protein
MRSRQMQQIINNLLLLYPPYKGIYGGEYAEQSKEKGVDLTAVSGDDHHVYADKYDRICG